MRFGVGVPNVAEFADPAFLLDLAQRAEAAGWDGFFVWDHLVYREPNRAAAHAWSVIAAAAAVTRRVRLGVLVTALPRRRPASFAQRVGTVDLLSHGRVIVGVGLGSMLEEYENFGEDPDPVARGRRLDEALEIVTALLQGEDVDHAGEFFTVRTTGFLPKPVQQPRPPIWIAGRWPNPRPFRRATRFEGIFATHEEHAHGSFISPSELEKIVEFLDRGRLVPDFDIVIEGESADPTELGSIIGDYDQVGLTWWIEKLGWWRGGLRAAISRVDDGPPAGGGG